MFTYDFYSQSITPKMKEDILSHVFSNIRDRFYQYSINRAGRDDIRPYDVTKFLEHNYDTNLNSLKINYGIVFGKKNFGNVSIDFVATKNPETDLSYSVENITVEFRNNKSWITTESHFISICRFELMLLFKDQVNDWDVLAKDIYNDMIDMQVSEKAEHLNILKYKISEIMAISDAIKSDTKFLQNFNFRRFF